MVVLPGYDENCGGRAVVCCCNPISDLGSNAFPCCSRLSQFKIARFSSYFHSTAIFSSTNYISEMILLDINEHIVLDSTASIPFRTSAACKSGYIS